MKCTFIVLLSLSVAVVYINALPADDQAEDLVVPEDNFVDEEAGAHLLNKKSHRRPGSHKHKKGTACGWLHKSQTLEQLTAKCESCKHDCKTNTKIGKKEKNRSCEKFEKYCSTGCESPPPKNKKKKKKIPEDNFMDEEAGAHLLNKKSHRRPGSHKHKKGTACGWLHKSQTPEQLTAKCESCKHDCKTNTKIGKREKNRSCEKFDKYCCRHPLGHKWWHEKKGKVLIPEVPEEAFAADSSEAGGKGCGWVHKAHGQKLINKCKTCKTECNNPNFKPGSKHKRRSCEKFRDHCPGGAKEKGVKAKLAEAAKLAAAKEKEAKKPCTVETCPCVQNPTCVSGADQHYRHVAAHGDTYTEKDKGKYTGTTGSEHCTPNTNRHVSIPIGTRNCRRNSFGHMSCGKQQYKKTGLPACRHFHRSGIWRL